MTDTIVIAAPAPAIEVLPTQGPTVSVAVQVVGIPGPTGAPGADADKTATWTQSIAASVWTITHALGKFPSVTIVDSSGAEIEGDIQYNSTSQVTASFSAAFAGVAYLN